MDYFPYYICSLALAIYFLVSTYALFRVPFAQGKKQLAYIDKWLICSCFVIALTVVMSYLPKPTKEPKSGSLKYEQTKTNIDLGEYRLLQSEVTPYINDLIPKELKFLRLPHDKQDTLLTTIGDLAKAQKDHPTSVDVMARTIIIRGEMGVIYADPTASSKFDENVQLKDLSTIYCARKLEGKSLIDLEKSVKDLLPSGWYQDTVLLKLYKASGNEAKRNELQNRLQVHYRHVAKSASILIATSGMLFLVGVYLLIRLYIRVFRKRDLKPEEKLVQAPANWGIRQIASIFMSLLWVGVPFGIVSGIADGTNPNMHLTQSMAFNTCVYLVSVIVPILIFYFWCCKPRGLDFCQSVGLRINKPQDVIWNGFKAYCIALPVIFTVSFITILITKTHGTTNPIIGDQIEAIRKNEFITMFVTFTKISLIAPFTEEIMFRGILYGWLRRSMNIPFACLVANGLFALIHIDPHMWFQLTALGIVFSLTFELTGSIAPGMVCHSIWNSSVALAMYIMFSG